MQFSSLVSLNLPSDFSDDNVFTSDFAGGLASGGGAPTRLSIRSGGKHGFSSSDGPEDKTKVHFVRQRCTRKPDGAWKSIKDLTTQSDVSCN